MWRVFEEVGFWDAVLFLLQPLKVGASSNKILESIFSLWTCISTLVFSLKKNKIMCNSVLFRLTPEKHQMLHFLSRSREFETQNCLQCVGV